MPDQNSIDPWKALVAFGDSITRGFGVPDGAGWIELAAVRARDHLGFDLKFINAGGNGNTSAEGLARFQTDVAPHLPAIVLVEFGGNDAVKEPERHVSPETFLTNIETITERVKADGGSVILVTFPALVSGNHSTANDPYFIERGGVHKVVDEYRTIIRTCAKRTNAPLFDLDGLTRLWIEKFGSEKIICPDGAHWTLEANQLAATSLLQFLAALAKKTLPTAW